MKNAMVTVSKLPNFIGLWRAKDGGEEVDSTLDSRPLPCTRLNYSIQAFYQTVRKQDAVVFAVQVNPLQDEHAHIMMYRKQPRTQGAEVEVVFLVLVFPIRSICLKQTTRRTPPTHTSRCVFIPSRSSQTSS